MSKPTPLLRYYKRDGWNNPSIKIFTIEPYEFDTCVSKQKEKELEDHCRLVVRAVNAHADLLAACKAVLGQRDLAREPLPAAVVAMIEEAVAKTEERNER